MTGYIELKNADLRAMIADYFASKMIRVEPTAIKFGTVYKPAWAYGDNGEEMFARIEINTEKKPEQ